ncbi:MAG: transporter, partial [Desulfobacterales bacterium]
MNKLVIQIIEWTKTVSNGFNVLDPFLKRLLLLFRWRFVVFFSACLLLAAWASAVQAQDVQTGHYAPGWNGNLKAGIMAPDPGFYMQSTTMFFNAQKFKDGSGDTASNDETDYVLTALALVWRPDFKLFGGDYQAVVTPAVGNLSGLPVLVDGEPQDAPVGFTDMFFSPIGLGWHWSEFHLITALGAFAPTGKFDFGENDNTGLGFWTVMPFTLGTYRTEKGIFKDTPLLATGGLFYEVHSNQQGRDFRPGDSFTFEWSLGLEFSEQTSF